MRALGYLRVSTDEQAEAGYSLPEQRDRFEEYCRQRGLTPVEIISDDFTGKILDRPGLKRVSQLAEAGAFDLLVCVKLDRLARHNYLRRQYEEWLLKRNIQVVFCEQHFEATPSGRLQKGIVGEFAEYESELIRERTMGGRLKKAHLKQRMPTNSSPYGLRLITRAEATVIADCYGRDGEFVIVPEEAVHVRRMFEECASGKSIRGAAAALNNEGIRTRAGGYWATSTVRGMLRNSVYVGRAYFGKCEARMTDELTAAGNVRFERKARARSEWVEIPCPAIVTEELFQAVQERLEENKERLKGRPTRVWLLHGAVTCGTCLEALGKRRSCQGNGRTHKRSESRAYVCYTWTRPQPGVFCGTRFSAGRLETMALDALRRAAEPHRLADFARQEAEERLRNADDPKVELNRLTSDLAALDTEEERVAELILAGISRGTVEKKIQDIRQRRDGLTRQIGEARGRAAKIADPEAAVKRAEAAAEHLRNALPEAERDPKLLQELLRLFLEVRIYGDREPEITARIPVLSQ